MKYILKHLKTGEETICDKVTIDGFDYYVSDELPKDNEGYWIYIGFDEPLEVVKSNQPQGWFEKLWDKANYKTPVATNNQNIDIPKVVDEVERLAHKDNPLQKLDGEFLRASFKRGYNKAKETHPNSDEDMIEFAKWLRQEDTEANAEKYANFTDADMLQLWKEQQPKTIYYNE